MPETKFHRAWTIFEDIQYEIRPRLNYLVHGRNAIRPETISEIGSIRRMIELLCKIIKFCLRDLNHGGYNLERSAIYTLQLSEMMRSLKISFHKLSQAMKRYDDNYPSDQVASLLEDLDSEL